MTNVSARIAPSRIASQWRSGFLSTSAPVFVVDEAGTIRYWNEGAARLTGYSASEVMGRRCSAVLCGTRSGRTWCESSCRVRRSVERGELPERVVVEVRTSAGRRIPVGMTFLVHEEETGKSIAHVLEDDSRKAQMHEALRDIRSLVDDLEAPRLCRTAPSESAPESPRADTTRELSVLTRREVEVLRLLAEGLSTKDAGRRLGVSALTARNHIQHAVRKLGAHNRAQAVTAVLAQRRG